MTVLEVKPLPRVKIELAPRRISRWARFVLGTASVGYLVVALGVATTGGVMLGVVAGGFLVAALLP